MENWELGIGNWELKVSGCRAHYRGGQHGYNMYSLAGGISPTLRSQAIYNSQFPIPNSQLFT